MFSSLSSNTFSIICVIRADIKPPPPCGPSSCGADSNCQSSPNTIEFGILLKALDLLSWGAKVGTHGAAGGLFIISISPTVCDGGAVEMQLPGETTTTSFVEVCVFLLKLLKRSTMHSPPAA